MAKKENPPFQPGQTFYGSATPPDATSNAQFEGKEWEFEDVDYSKTPPVVRSNRYVVRRVVRNVSGISLLPMRLAKFKQSGLLYGAQVDGYTGSTTGDNEAAASGTADRGYPIDEFLPAAGVQNNDLFYIVVSGPAMCITGLATLAGTFFVGDRLVAQTAVTSQATSAGRVDMAATTATTGVFSPLLMNTWTQYIGRALSGAPTAATANNTGTNLLVDVGHW